MSTLLPPVPDVSMIGALNRQPENLNFLQALKFKFQIFKLPNTNYFVQRCNLPGISANIVEQKTPLQDVPLPGTKLKYNDLVITFRINADFSNYLELFTWINGEDFPKDQREYANLKAEFRDISQQFGGIVSDAQLILMNNKEEPIIIITFVDAFVKSLSDLYFDSTTKDGNFLVCEATFDYAYININLVR